MWWCYRTANVDPETIPANAWTETFENRIFPMPTDPYGPEEGWLYVWVRLEGERIYGTLPLSFAALSSLEEDSSLAVTVLSGKDGVDCHRSGGSRMGRGRGDQRGHLLRRGRQDVYL